MNGKDLLMGLGNINPRYYEEAENDTISSPKSRRTIRRPLLVASIVALMLLLVGCTVAYVLNIQGIHIGEQESLRDVFAYDPDTGEAVEYLGQETITEQVFTLAGLKGSPNYLAAQEWFEFNAQYDPDYSIRIELHQSGKIPTFPSEYESYNIYTQEMKDKLDDILEKYNLIPIGSVIPFRTEELTCRALGLEDIIVPGNDAVMDLDYAVFQECGNLNMDFNIIMSNGDETRCHIYYMRKNAFTEDIISLEEIETWKEWNYTTASGADVLIFSSPVDWRGYVFCDMPNFTVTLQFEFIDEVYSNDEAGNNIIEKTEMTSEQIKQLADAIDFSIEPELIDGWENLDDSAVTSGVVIDGYSIELKSIESDGYNAFITLAITAPEEIALMDSDGNPFLLKHGNRWGFFEQVTEGSSNVSGGYMMEDDGDGMDNTVNCILEYTAGSDQLKDGKLPFAEGKVWNIYWQDIYTTWWNEETNCTEKLLLAEGTWSFDVVFENVVTAELELIETPIPSRTAVGWDLKGNDVYEDTHITSFILRPMSAMIVCDVDCAPDFLTEGDRCIYVVMKNGSKITLNGDSAGSGIQHLQPKSPIDIENVDHVILADGTKIPVPTQDADK